MASIIRSIRNGLPLTEVIGASRDDLRQGDLVTCNAVTAHTTYQWSLDFTPQDLAGTPSTATLSSTTNAITAFSVDNEGSYLLRLVVDAGLGTESSQTVRLRALTVFGQLRLVAAGERKDTSGIIPVDISTEGWANNQNANLQSLLYFTKKVSSSGRVYYVDANKGTDYSNPQNDSTIAEGYADFYSIQDAITAAANDAVTPSEEEPFTIVIRPGLYIEDITLEPFVHLLGLPHSQNIIEDKTVTVRTLSAGVSLETNLPLSTDLCIIYGVSIEGTDTTNTVGVINKTGSGKLILKQCSVNQKANDASIGPAILCAAGTLEGSDCVISSEATALESLVAYKQDGPNTTSSFEYCKFEGPSGVNINYAELLATTAVFNYCTLTSNAANVAAFGLMTSAELTVLNYCTINLNPASTNGVEIHPSGLAFAGDVYASLRWSKISGDISFNATGLSGNSVLDFGSLEYSSLNVTGSLTAGPNALIQGKTLFYDNSISSLSSENVQDALDELAATIGGVTITIQDEGVGLGTFGTMNFVGAAVSATPGTPGVIDVNVINTGLASTELIVRETPTGAIDGINLLFTLASAAMISGSEQVYLNGIMLDTLAGDYIFTGPNIIDFTPTGPPEAGDILRVTYLDSIAGTGFLVVRDNPTGLINGINTIYTLTNPSIITGSEQVFFNGALLDPIAGDYIFTAPNIINLSPIGAPLPGDILRITYLKP